MSTYVSMRKHMCVHTQQHTGLMGHRSFYSSNQPQEETGWQRVSPEPTCSWTIPQSAHVRPLMPCWVLKVPKVWSLREGEQWLCASIHHCTCCKLHGFRSSQGAPQSPGHSCAYHLLLATGSLLASFKGCISTWGTI